MTAADRDLERLPQAGHLATARAAVPDVRLLLATVATAALVLSGCLARPSAPLAPGFTRLLGDTGTVFTQAVAPPAVADWQRTFAAEVGGYLQRHGTPGAERSLRPIYGVIRCVDPARGCDVFDIAEVGQERAVWYADFEDRSGCQAWITVDPQTGALGVGGGGRRAGACSP